LFDNEKITLALNASSVPIVIASSAHHGFFNTQNARFPIDCP
jgi:hypothetical protein